MRDSRTRGIDDAGREDNDQGAIQDSRGGMSLNTRFLRLVEPFQVDYVGFADLTRHQDALTESGGDIVRGYPCGISIGIAIPDSIVDFLEGRSDMGIAGEYRIHGYDSINSRLNVIASMVASYLMKNGYRALPIPAADKSNREGVYGLVSHKMIAHIAGLGWIGKNCLLITREHGPRVRFISILTDAPFRRIDDPIEQRCGDCMECVTICPTKSIKGRNFALGEDREERLDFRRCDSYFEAMKKSREYAVCGMCLYACPYGRRHD